MYTKAAILKDLKKPLIIDEIEIPPLKEGQVLVEIKYSGICHTQLLEIKGLRGDDPFLPHLLGHEGSGIVKEVSKGVTKVKRGDHVILSWMKGSGKNVPGSIYNWKNKKINSGAITTFSRYSVISENRLTPIEKDFSLLKAALIGCALPTGLGAVFNSAKAKKNKSIAIFGIGGIGMSALKGAKYRKCFPIFAIDIKEQKLSLAKKLGATHLINSLEKCPIEEIKKIGFLDFAIEASGSIIAMDQAIRSIKPRGGTAVIIGNAPHGNTLTIDPREFNMGKRILGSWGGDNNPDIHFPKYLNLLKKNNIPVNHLINDIYPLSKINEAFKDLEEGKVYRPIIDMFL